MKNASMYSIPNSNSICIRRAANEKRLKQHQKQMRKAAAIMFTIWGSSIAAVLGGAYWIHVNGAMF